MGRNTYDGLDAVKHVWLDASLRVLDVPDEPSKLVLLDHERHFLLVIHRLVCPRFARGSEGGGGGVGRRHEVWLTRSGHRAIDLGGEALTSCFVELTIRCG